MPSNSSQLNLIRRDTAEILASCSQSIAKLSIIAVNRDLSSAHGTFTCRTPCSLHLTRGTSAVRIVRYWHVSKCRHDRRRASCRFATFTALRTQQLLCPVMLDEYLDLLQSCSHFHFTNQPRRSHSKNRRVQLFVMHNRPILQSFAPRRPRPLSTRFPEAPEF